MLKNLAENIRDYSVPLEDYDDLAYIIHATTQKKRETLVTLRCSRFFLFTF